VFFAQRLEKMGAKTGRGEAILNRAKSFGKDQIAVGPNEDVAQASLRINRSTRGAASS
jgi:hypothetical protein